MIIDHRMLSMNNSLAGLRVSLAASAGAVIGTSVMPSPYAKLRPISRFAFAS
jgi:hypothetical protein